jgi:hypothetical protein
MGESTSLPVVAEADAGPKLGATSIGSGLRIASRTSGPIRALQNMSDTNYQFFALDKDPPPSFWVLSRVKATTPSFTNNGYFILRPTRLARASANAGTNTACIASCRRFCNVVSGSASLDQRDLMTLTRTRVPSLLTAIVSERRTSAMICSRPAGDVESFEAKTRSQAFWTVPNTGDGQNLRSCSNGKNITLTVTVTEMLHDSDRSHLHDLCHRITPLVPNTTGD